MIDWSLYICNMKKYISSYKICIYLEDLTYQSTRSSDFRGGRPGEYQGMEVVRKSYILLRSWLEPSRSGGSPCSILNVIPCMFSYHQRFPLSNAFFQLINHFFNNFVSTECFFFIILWVKNYPLRNFGWNPNKLVTGHQWSQPQWDIQVCVRLFSYRTLLHNL